MRRSLRPAPVLVALTVLCLLLSACSDGGGDGKDAEREPAASATPSAAATPSRATPPPPPRAGACYRLTYTAATRTASDARPVACRQEHSAVTMFVGRLANVSDGHLLAVDSEQVAQRLSARCPKQLERFLGGDREARRLSRFTAVWFTPTLEQAQQGADWFRCDLVALAGRDRLLPLPREAKGALDRDGTLDRYGTCGTAAPGSAKFVRVACARPHAWRAVSTIDLPEGARYLAKDATESADGQCRDVAADASDFALRFSWSFEWPDRKSWREGQRWGTCWLPVDR